MGNVGAGCEPPTYGIQAQCSTNEAIVSVISFKKRFLKLPYVFTCQKNPKKSSSRPRKSNFHLMSTMRVDTVSPHVQSVISEWLHGDLIAPG